MLLLLLKKAEPGQEATCVGDSVCSIGCVPVPCRRFILASSEFRKGRVVLLSFGQHRCDRQPPFPSPYQSTTGQYDGTAVRRSHSSPLGAGRRLVTAAAAACSSHQKRVTIITTTINHHGLCNSNIFNLHSIQRPANTGTGNQTKLYQIGIAIYRVIKRGREQRNTSEHSSSVPHFHPRKEPQQLLLCICGRASVLDALTTSSSPSCPPTCRPRS